jgi:hypothetical protein
LHQRVHLQPGVLNVGLDRQIIEGAVDASFLVRRVAGPAGGGEPADDRYRAATQRNRQRKGDNETKDGT